MALTAKCRLSLWCLAFELGHSPLSLHVQCSAQILSLLVLFVILDVLHGDLVEVGLLFSRLCQLVWMVVAVGWEFEIRLSPHGVSLIVGSQSKCRIVLQIMEEDPVRLSGLWVHVHLDPAITLWVIEIEMIVFLSLVLHFFDKPDNFRILCLSLRVVVN